MLKLTRNTEKRTLIFQAPCDRSRIGINLKTWNARIVGHNLNFWEIETSHIIVVAPEELVGQLHSIGSQHNFNWRT